MARQASISFSKAFRQHSSAGRRLYESCSAFRKLFVGGLRRVSLLLVQHPPSIISTCPSSRTRPRLPGFASLRRSDADSLLSLFTGFLYQRSVYSSILEQTDPATKADSRLAIAWRPTWRPNIGRNGHHVVGFVSVVDEVSACRQECDEQKHLRKDAWGYEHFNK